MNFSPLTNFIKKYPIAVTCWLLIVVFAVLILLRSGVAAELEITESDLNARIRTIEQNDKNSIDIQQDTEDLTVLVEKMKTLLFNPNERAINVDFFYRLEDLANVVISEIRQLPMPDPIYAEKGPRELKLHTTLVFDISCRGTFENILKFMNDIHRVEPFIRIADFELSRQDRQVDSSIVNARMRLIVLAKK